MKTTKKLFSLILLAFLTVQCSNDEGDDTNTVGSPPVADFDALATTIRAGTRVQFVNGSTNATSFEWTFEGGTPGTSIEVEPSIEYQVAGTYDVTLTAINSEAENTLLLENFITVVDPPAAN